MSKRVRALVITISTNLIEELLKKYVKNIPEDLKFDSADYSWSKQDLKIYLRSKKFPIIKDKFKENAIAGKIKVTVDKNRKITKMILEWQDPRRKEKIKKEVKNESCQIKNNRT